MAQVTKLIHKNLNSSVQHEILLYSTLLAKLIEGANHVININMHIEERAYEVSLRNPEGVKVLTGLPNHIIAKGFDGLVTAERAQVRLSFILIPILLFEIIVLATVSKVASLTNDHVVVAIILFFLLVKCLYLCPIVCTSTLNVIDKYA